MSYKMHVSQTTTPEIFNALHSIVTFLANEYNTRDREELITLFRNKFNVVIVQAEKSILDYNVDFQSEENFAWIMLQWG